MCGARTLGSKTPFSARRGQPVDRLAHHLEGAPQHHLLPGIQVWVEMLTELRLDDLALLGIEGTGVRRSMQPVVLAERLVALVAGISAVFQRDEINLYPG